MVSRFVRRVRTASGAVAVQVVTRRGRQVVGVEHVGSAHADEELALLVAAAKARLVPEGQGVLDLGEMPVVAEGMDAVADWTVPVELSLTPSRSPSRSRSPPSPSPSSSRPRLSLSAPAGVAGRVEGRGVATSSLLLWQVLTGVYARLGFDVLGDDAFRAMVVARIIEPTSKADTVRVLGEAGAPCPTVRTLFRALKRCQDRDYRDTLAKACAARSAAAGGLNALVMYDCTTLHFEVSDEDPGPAGLRRVGMSKEHRVDPQVQVGLLVDPSGFPLEVHLFEGNTAETTTLLPVLRKFQERHGITGLVVVADAGMLSAGNLNAIEDAGYSFIVGSRISKAPYDLADHFHRHGDYFTDGQILESSRAMGSGKHERARRIVYQYRFKRAQRDNKAINAQITKAERVAAGTAPMARTRFLKITGATTELNQTTIDRARQLAGLKGYVTNLAPEKMDGASVIAAYHDLWQVEASFRMTKSDLRARPIFHRQQESIQAHLTVVFAALAISRYLHRQTGLSIKRLVQTLRTARSATIEIGGQRLTLEPEISEPIRTILDRLEEGH